MKNQKLFFTVIFMCCVVFAGCKAQSQNESMKLISSIALPDVNGRIDHLSYDFNHQKLFVAALGNNTVEIIDLTNQKVIHSIKNLSKPQGVAFIAERNSFIVANGDNGLVELYDAVSYQKNSSVQLSGDADNVRYHPISHKIYVGYGHGGIAVIDAKTFKLITEIKLSGHPESFQLDKSANKIFVNVPDAKQIEVIDLGKNSVTDKWAITETRANYPMSLDETNHRLFVGCRNEPKLLIIDTQIGKTVASFPIDGDVDDIFYNAKRKEIYLSCGGGYIDMFKQIDANTYETLGKISTGKGARTSFFIPDLNKFIVASPASLSTNASVLIYGLK
jgi:YVTN family beta-propeller protein